MTVAISTDAAQTGWLKIKILGNATAAGLIGQVYNPEGVLLQIVRGLLYVVTPSAAAMVPKIGIAATGVSNDSLWTTAAMNAPGAGTVWQVVGQDLASEGAATTPKGLLWPATSYLTVTSTAQVSPALEAYLFLQYVRLA
mgnify:CR=1 FL=1